MIEYVYFVGTVNYDGLLKIGKTRRSLNERLTELRTKNQLNLKVYHYITTFDCHRLELELHRKYRHRHEGREWFRFSIDEVQQMSLVHPRPALMFRDNVEAQTQVDLERVFIYIKTLKRVVQGVCRFVDGEFPSGVIGDSPEKIGKIVARCNCLVALTSFSSDIDGSLTRLTQKYVAGRM